MLDIGVHAFALCADNDVSPEITCKERVFAVVLPVASRKRRTMNIDCRRIPTAVCTSVAFGVTDKTFQAGHYTHVVGKVLVPSCADDAFRSVETRIVYRRIAHKHGKSRRSVGVGGTRFTYFVQCNGMEVALSDKLHHFVNGQIVDKFVPLFAVVVHTYQIVQLRRSTTLTLRACCSAKRSHIVAVGVIVSVGKLGAYVVGNLTVCLCRGSRECTVETTTRHYLATHISRHISKTVVACRACSINIHRVGHVLKQRVFACDFILACPCVVSISAKIQRVGTHIEFVTTIPVAVSVGVVVADHIFEIYTDCIFTALSRRKQIGLGNAAKYNVRLFYAVVDIRRTVVQLYYVLARVLRAYVSDLDGYINLVVCVFVKSRTHGSRFAFHNFPLEVGVALTISERKHYTAVVPTTVVAETVNVLVTARFVVAVTEIQSFLVLYKVVARLRRHCRFPSDCHRSFAKWGQR